MDEFRALVEFAVHEDVSFAFHEYELESQNFPGFKAAYAHGWIRHDSG
jgi:hypothetical protein